MQSVVAITYQNRSFHPVMLHGKNDTRDKNGTHDNSNVSVELRETPVCDRMGSAQKLEKHATLFHAGDLSSRLYIVERGAVMIYLLLDDGRRQIVEIVLPGGICGFSCGEVYTSSCEALTTTHLRSYRKADIGASDSLRRFIMGKAEEQVCHMHEHAMSLGRKSAEERVASLLARFAAHGTVNTAKSGVSMELPMTRAEMGDYLGLSLETVCRTLTSLQRQGLISIGRRHGEVIVNSLKRLRRAAAMEQVAI